MTQLRRGDRLQQRYRVLETIGSGGFGRTYSAVRDDGERVVLKELELRRAADLKAIELFEREARVLARLDHPAIPRYLDSFTVEQHGRARFFLVQALAEGQTVAERVAAGWRPAENEVVELSAQLLDVLVYLQLQQPPVIHRDIKPQNVIVAADGAVSLVDFGSVRSTWANTFAGGSTIVGTYGYMAPEQLLGQAVPATDLYGMGCTLLFAATHLPPWDLPMEQLRMRFRDKVNLAPWLCDWLEGLVEPALEDRFESAADARQALHAERGTGRKRPKARPGLRRLPHAALVVLLLLLGGGAAALLLSRSVDQGADRAPAPASQPGRQAPAAAAQQDPPPLAPAQIARLLPQLRDAHRLLLTVEPSARQARLKAALARIESTAYPGRTAARRASRAALETIRALRAEASVPAVFRLFHLKRDDIVLLRELTNTATVLTGRRFGAGWRLSTYDISRVFAKMAAEWQRMKGGFSTDLLRMSPPQQRTAIRALTSRRRRPLSHCSAENANRQMGELMASRGRVPGERDALARVPTSLLPRVLEVAGEPDQFSYDVVELLSKMRRAGAAKDIDAAVHDAQRSSMVRLQAALSSYLAGAPLDHRAILELARAEKRLCPLTLLLLALQYAPAADRPTKALLSVHLGHGNAEIRKAATYALAPHGTSGEATRIEKTRRYYQGRRVNTTKGAR